MTARILPRPSCSDELTLWQLPMHTPRNWETTKQLARDLIYDKHCVTFYCGCSYEPVGKYGGGVIDLESCGYLARTASNRAARLEWEHVVPASFLGRHYECWTVSLPDCTKAGRDCCTKYDPHYQRMAFDLHNLVPAIGEINGDRGNFVYGILTDSNELDYGACDFEIHRARKIAEPAPDIRGDIARIWLYMSHLYNLTLDTSLHVLYENWRADDPVSAWEIERDQHIYTLQGNHNPFVYGWVDDADF